MARHSIWRWLDVILLADARIAVKLVSKCERDGFIQILYINEGRRMYRGLHSCGGGVPNRFSQRRLRSVRMCSAMCRGQVVAYL